MGIKAKITGRNYLFYDTSELIPPKESFGQPFSFKEKGLLLVLTQYLCIDRLK
jgi:hypothetical protein